SLKRTGSTTTSDLGLARFRRVIVAAQVAVVLPLLVGAGLLLKSFGHLQHVDLGFQGDGVLTMEMRLLNPKYRQPDRIVQFQDEILTRIRTLPAVEQVGLTTAVPMRGTDFT